MAATWSQDNSKQLLDTNQTLRTLSAMLAAATLAMHSVSLGLTWMDGSNLAFIE